MESVHRAVWCSTTSWRRSCTRPLTRLCQYCHQLERDECVEGTPRHPQGFAAVAAALHVSAQEVRMPRMHSDGWDLPPTRSCGHVRMPDHFVAEGSDELLTRLDVIMSSEFEAKLLGRVGRGHCPVIKFLKHTLRWHEEEESFSWSGGTRYVEELAQRRRRTQATQQRRRRRLWSRAGTAGPFPGGGPSDPTCQFAANKT